MCTRPAETGDALIASQRFYDSYAGIISGATCTTRNAPAPTIRIISDNDGFSSLVREWESLETISSSTIFQTFDWQFLWWKHFAASPANQLLILLFSDGSEVAGIAPFFIQHYSFLGFKVFRKLKLLGSGLGYSGSPVLSLDSTGPTDYLDVLIKPGHESRVAEALATFLHDFSYLWDEIELQNIPGESNVYRHLVPILEASNRPVIKEVSDICPRVLLPDSVDKFMSSLKYSARRKLQNSRIQFLNNPECTVDEITTGADTDEAMDVLSSLHQRRWNRIGYPGLFSDKRFKAFQSELAGVMNRKGRLWLRILRRNGKAISARLCFKFKSEVYDYLSGFDTEYEGPSKNSPGLALVFSMISDSITSGLKIFDMIRGNEHYKLKLTPVVQNNWAIRVGSTRRTSFTRGFIFRIYELRCRIMSRVTCEKTILALVAEEAGALRSIPLYLLHVLRRSSLFPATLTRFTDPNRKYARQEQSTTQTNRIKTLSGNNVL